MKQKGKLTTVVSVNKKSLRVSYLVALQVAKAKKPRTIAQDLILPAALDMCEAVLGEEFSKKLKYIPLSDNTIQLVDLDFWINRRLNILLYPPRLRPV